VSGGRGWVINEIKQTFDGFDAAFVSNAAMSVFCLHKDVQARNRINVLSQFVWSAIRELEQDFSR